MLPRNSIGTVIGLCLFALASLATAQPVPVQVQVSGNVATVVVGDAANPLADLTLAFDDASALTPANLGISAELIQVDAPALVARLPLGAGVASGLPLSITIEPPVGGLNFRRLVNVEIHTHALVYTAGSPFRVFKAPLGGAFRDITNEVAPGSVRTRGTTGGFSQFLVLADLRPSSVVIAQKFSYLRNQLALLPVGERAPLTAHLGTAESAVAQSQFPQAMAALDAFTARVSQRAGSHIPQQWSAGGTQQNVAGELLAGAATLEFSIGVLRDFGS